MKVNFNVTSEFLADLEAEVKAGAAAYAAGQPQDYFNRLMIDRFGVRGRIVRMTNRYVRDLVDSDVFVVCSYINARGELVTCTERVGSQIHGCGASDGLKKARDAVVAAVTEKAAALGLTLRDGSYQE